MKKRKIRNYQFSFVKLIDSHLEITNKFFKILEELDEKKFEEIISELKFIAKVKAGEKINVDRREIISNSYCDRIYRTYQTKEDGEFTLNILKI